MTSPQKHEEPPAAPVEERDAGQDEPPAEDVAPDLPDPITDAEATPINRSDLDARHDSSLDALEEPGIPTSMSLPATQPPAPRDALETTILEAVEPVTESFRDTRLQSPIPRPAGSRPSAPAPGLLDLAPPASSPSPARLQSPSQSPARLQVP